MILLPLWMAAFTGAGQAAQDAGARRRVHELRGRLGVREVAAPPGGVMRRIQWAMDFVGDEAGQRLVELVGDRLFYLRHGEAPGPGGRDLPLEQVLPWWALQLKRGVVIQDLPWEEEWRATRDGQRYAQDLHRIRHPYTTQGFLDDLIRHLHASGNNEPVYVFTRGTMRDSSIVSPADRLTFDTEAVRLVGSTSVRAFHAEDLLLGVLFPRLLDWVEQTHPDLNRLSFAAACAAATAWHRSFGDPVRAESPVPLRPGDEVLATFSDGARIVSLRTKHSLEDEGESMQHCVGGYWPRVRSGETLIWSYRDPSGTPLLTLELDPGTKRIRQLHGRRDLTVDERFYEESGEQATAALRLAWTWLRTIHWTLTEIPEDLCRFGLALPRPVTAEAIRFLEDLDQGEALRALEAWKAQARAWGPPPWVFTLAEGGEGRFDLVNRIASGFNVSGENQIALRLDPMVLFPFLHSVLGLTAQDKGMIPILNTGDSLSIGNYRAGVASFLLQVSWPGAGAAWVRREDLQMWVDIAYHRIPSRTRTISSSGTPFRIVDSLRNQMSETQGGVHDARVKDYSEASLSAWFARLATDYGASWP